MGCGASRSVTPVSAQSLDALAIDKDSKRSLETGQWTRQPTNAYPPSQDAATGKGIVENADSQSFPGSPVLHVEHKCASGIQFGSNGEGKTVEESPVEELQPGEVGRSDSISDRRHISNKAENEDLEEHSLIDADNLSKTAATAINFDTATRHLTPAKRHHPVLMDKPAGVLPPLNLSVSRAIAGLMDEQVAAYETESGDQVSGLPDIEKIGRTSLGKVLRTPELHALGLLARFDKEGSAFVEKTARYESAEFQRAILAKRKDKKLKPIRRKRKARRASNDAVESLYTRDDPSANTITEQEASEGRSSEFQDKTS